MPRRLAVVAGAGALAPQVAEVALAAGDTVCAFLLSPLQLPSAVEQLPASVSTPETLFASIRAFGATHLTLAGSVNLGDADRRRIAEALGGPALSQGDAALSHLAGRLQAITGAKLLGAHEIVPELLAPLGTIAGPEPTEAARRAAAQALRAARHVGLLDLGQAAVAAGARVVALEDVAGTDELLQRVARHRDAGLLGSEPLALAKASKPRQPLFVDLPAIGPRTVEGAALAGIRVIAVEAGRTLLLERQRLEQLAVDRQLSILGLRPDD